MSETTSAETTWQPEPAAIHPSLDRYQRLSAFTLDPTPPPGGARMVKGMVYHAVCGTPMTSKVLTDPAFGEYGCRTCEERGYLVKVPAADLPDPQHQNRPTSPTAPARNETRALVAVEAAERLVVRAYKTLAALSDDDLRMAPLSVVAAVQQARAILAETANVTTTTTVSIVKDQTWSDEISRGASESVNKAMTHVERALAPR